MRPIIMLLTSAAALPVYLFGGETADSIGSVPEKELELNEVVVVANKSAVKSAPDRIIYLPENDPFASGLDGIQVLDRIPRVSVTNDQVNVAGKTSVKYIIDGQLLEMPDEAIALRLKNIQSSAIKKIEILTTPPAKYAAASGVAFISITTRDESLGTRGNVWGNGNAREVFSYLLGGNISHATHRIELSADGAVYVTKGINDLNRTYSFPDNQIITDRTNRFTNRSDAINGLFRYKATDRLSYGAILNYSMMRLKSNIFDETLDNGITSYSRSFSPSRPNNAFTLTAFTDWAIDRKGKSLSLTYNYFSRHLRSTTDVNTWLNHSEKERLTDESINKYRIHSVKLDMALPLSSLRLDAGASYTAIENATEICNFGYIDDNPVENSHLSNTFNYHESTCAIYVSAEKNLTKSLFSKIGLRYEMTEVSGMQYAGNLRHGKSYGYLFPSLNLSWNTPTAGRLSISCSMGISRPNFSDLNPFRYYTTVSDYYSGNPDLSPSISHNAELNFSNKGIYAVLYGSFNHNAIGNITRFNPDGSRHTLPENCLNTVKAGLYASLSRLLFRWWNVKVAGEAFFSIAESKINDFKDTDEHSWSGKLELNGSWMLNKQKTLILDFRLSHRFPWKERMVSYSSVTLTGCELRYSLLNDRLKMALSVNDPFGWNITKSRVRYHDYIVKTVNDIHSHSVTFRASWSFGGIKVRNVYRDNKERESQRAY